MAILAMIVIGVAIAGMFLYLAETIQSGAKKPCRCEVVGLFCC